MNRTEKENLQNSFQKIKEEMNALNEEISFLKKQLSQTNKSLNYLNQYLSKHLSLSSTSISTSTTDNQQIVKNPAQNPSYNLEVSPKSPVSIGNEGVPADSQQTVSRHILSENELKSPSLSTTPSSSTNRVEPVDKTKNSLNLDISNLSTILEDLKKELKQKFKNLTNQELLIFSLIYTLNEEKSEVTYKDISIKANLTESSVRDYISRLEHKGIPLIKEKKNNKMVVLKIPEELKHISTLDNLTKLSKNL
jgi:hypothetical protein